MVFENIRMPFRMSDTQQTAPEPDEDKGSLFSRFRMPYAGSSYTPRSHHRLPWEGVEASADFLPNWEADQRLGLPGSVGHEDPGTLRYIGGSLKRSVVTPLTGLAELAGVVEEGTTHRQKEEFQSLQDEYLAADPGALRSTVGLLAPAAADALAVTLPGGLQSKIATRGMGLLVKLGASGKAAELAAGALYPAVEGSLYGLGESADSTPSERFIGTALGGTLGGVFGAVMRAHGKIDLRNLDAEARSRGENFMTWVVKNFTSDGIIPHDSKRLLERATSEYSGEMVGAARNAINFEKVRVKWLKGNKSVNAELFDQELRRAFDGEIGWEAFDPEIATSGQKLRDHVNTLRDKLLETLPKDSDIYKIISENNFYTRRSFEALERLSLDPTVEPWKKRALTETYIDKNGTERSVWDAAYQFIKDRTDAAAEKSYGAGAGLTHEQITDLMVRMVQRDVDSIKAAGGNLYRAYEGIFKKKNMKIPEPILALLGETRDVPTSYIRTVSRMSQTIEAYKLHAELRDNHVGRIVWDHADHVPGGPANAVELKFTKLSPSYETVQEGVNLRDKTVAKKGTVVRRGSKEGSKGGKALYRVEQLNEDGTVTIVAKKNGRYRGKTYDVDVADLRAKGTGERVYHPDEANTVREIVDAGEEPLWTTPEIRDIITGADRVMQVGHIGFVNAITKEMKTVGSIQTQARNFLSNALFAVANGDIVAGVPKGMYRKVASERGLWFDMADDELERAFVALAKAGVTHEGVALGEVKMYHRAMNDYLSGKLSPAGWGKIRKSLAKSAGFVQRKAESAYALGDEVWKVRRFYAELNNQKFIHAAGLKDGTIKLSTLEEIAADITRDTMPTWSRAPLAAMKLSRNPLVGTFVSFPMETFRITKNIAKRGLREIASSNARERVIGAKRLAGLVGALTIPSGAVSIMHAVNGVNDEDAKNLRNNFVAPWDRNAQIAITEKKDLTYTYFNASFMDPFSYVKKPVIALLGGGDPDHIIGNAAWEFLQPYLGEEIAAGAMLDVATNQRGTILDYVTGGESAAGSLYNTESKEDIIQKSAEHLYRGLAPGTLLTAERITRGAKAGFGKDILPDFIKPTNRHGTSYQFGTEIAAIAGPRFTTVDLTTSMKYRSSELHRRMREAKSLFNAEKYRKDPSPNDLKDARRKTNEAWNNINSEAIDTIEAARKLGMTDQQILSILREVKFSLADARRLLRGEYWNIAVE